MSDLNINTRIAQLEEKVKDHGKQIHELKNLLEKVRLQKMPSEFDDLVALLKSNNWPSAIEPSLICDVSSEQDKEDRAEGILELIIDVSLENKSFLDFGCDEGHVVKRAAGQKTKACVGYDIKESPKWKEWKNVFFTTDWEEVKKKGPFDIILLYDVIDHIADKENIPEILTKIKGVLAPTGKIFIRCHPFVSRHGTHLYHQTNKAYAHLVFHQKELDIMDLKGLFTRKVIHPIATYEGWFRGAGLNLSRAASITRKSVEPFFINTPIIAKRIKERYADSFEPALRSGQQFPAMQLEQQFLDYVLTH